MFDDDNDNSNNNNNNNNLPCQLAGTEERRSWEFSKAWHQLDACTNIWVGKAERTTIS